MQELWHVSPNRWSSKWPFSICMKIIDENYAIQIFFLFRLCFSLSFLQIFQKKKKRQSNSDTSFCESSRLFPSTSPITWDLEHNLENLELKFGNLIVFWTQILHSLCYLRYVIALDRSHSLYITPFIALLRLGFVRIEYPWVSIVVNTHMLVWSSVFLIFWLALWDWNLENQLINIFISILFIYTIYEKYQTKWWDRFYTL